MNQLNKIQLALHSEAVRLVKNIERDEASLVEVLREAEKANMHKAMGYRSLFKYATLELKLTDQVALYFIGVARKTATVPALREAVSKKIISVSKASRIVSVITNANAAGLIEIAATKTSRVIDLEVAKINPKVAVKEGVRPVSENLLELRAGISKEGNGFLERAKDLMAQKSRNHVGIGSTLEIALKEYVEKHDPVERAKRSVKRKQRKAAKTGKAREKALLTNGPSENRNQANYQQEGSLTAKDSGEQQENCHIVNVSEEQHQTKIPQEDILIARASENQTETQQKESLCLVRVNGRREAKNARVPLTADQKHAVFLRDEGRCTHIDVNGSRCDCKRWLDIHHIVSVANGGTNESENLVTLCSFHHDLVHQLSLPIEGGVSWLRSPRVEYGT